MAVRTICVLLTMAAGCLLLVPTAARTAEGPTAVGAEWTVDHRWAPPWWQTSICLPDDWQKTLVGKEGQLLYDYRGKFSDFQTRITFALEGETDWVRQELVSPRVPIVRTIKRQGSVEIIEEAMAVAPPLRPGQEGTVVERLDDKRDLPNWAAPKGECDPAFRHIAVGFNQSIRYRFRAYGPGPYTVVFGLCEGHWREPAKRPVVLQIEGRAKKTVDMVGEFGHNVPALFPFEARDENGDGWIDLTVAAAAGAPDKNTILNVLWIFDGDAPPMDELLSGQSSRPPLAHINCGMPLPDTGPPRNDLILVRLRNKGEGEVTVQPTVLVESEMPVALHADPTRVAIGTETILSSPQSFEAATLSDGPKDHRVRLTFKPVKLTGGAEGQLVVGVGRGQNPQLVPKDWSAAVSLRRRAEQYWERADLPYGRIQVPDLGIQAQLDSAIRNIYQAREIKEGLPAFQVGPTCYRGLWVVDGSFLMEAVAFLGRVDDARAGMQYLLGFQRDDGAVMIIDGHWKETGIALWALTRHARLTNDPTWLFEVWPNVERGFDYIRSMRARTWGDPKAPNFKLIPDGFSDGGLSGKYPEYTNVYWTLVGMRAAIDAAEWLGLLMQAAEWQQEYDDFYAAFRHAAERDMVTDAHGNRCLPIRMRDDQNVPVQKAQWAFLHALFPGKIFAPDDPLVQGNLAMLRSVEREGLVYDTGWVAKGVWNYFGSFYAHGWLWTGDGQKAARTLYAFANHASPLLVWREEQRPLGEGPEVCGDMPHNWASAELIRLVRHLLVLERESELHLFEGLPPAWVRPGAVTRMQNVLTEFGPISFELRAAADGSQATLKLDPPRRNPPTKLLVHLDGWSGAEGTLELPGGQPVEREIPLQRR
jgi:hypothetical protein